MTDPVKPSDDEIVDNLDTDIESPDTEDVDDDDDEESDSEIEPTDSKDVNNT